MGLALVVLSAAWWLAQLGLILRARGALTRVAALPLEARPTWPTVSVVIPARNEGAHVRAALEAKLADGYPALQVVLVDDRSTDDTGAQARAIAAGDARVSVVRVEALPEGWLGKVHALQRGLEQARGPWLLFSDADVHLAPGTLQRLVAFAEARGAEHVCALPQIVSRGPGVAIALAHFMRLVSTLFRPWAAEDPSSSAFIGVGAFNLFRREALERTAGLEWLKMEVGDDGALGLLLKRTGAKQVAVVGAEAVSLEFYPSLRAMLRALEKNGATAPWPLLLLGSAALVALELGWLAAAVAPTPLAIGVGVLGVVAGVAAQGLAASWLSLARWPALLPGSGMLLLGVAIARSALLAAVRGGVVWRGTFYPTATVRAGQRVGKAGPSPFRASVEASALQPPSGSSRFG